MAPDQRLIDLATQHVATFVAHDWAAYKRQLTPDAVYVEPGTGRTVKGDDAYIEAVRGWVEAFPDMACTVESALGSGDRVVLELTWAGTQTGPLVGPLGTIPPTGKYGTVGAVQIVRFENGKVKELHHYFDLMTILRNIGAVPAPRLAA